MIFKSVVSTSGKGDRKIEFSHTLVEPILSEAEKVSQLLETARNANPQPGASPWVPIKRRALKLWTLAELENVNKNDDACFVIIEGHVYDLSKWKNCHPGGAIVLQHMKSRDATDEVIAFHPGSVLEQQMPGFCVGRLVDPKPRSLTSLAYQALERDLQRLKFYETPYEKYGYECLKLALLFALAMTFTLHARQTYLNLSVGAFFLGALWHQAAFLGHDMGHNSVFHDYFWDNTVGTFLAVWIGGLSLGWWKKSHDVHHVVTNHPEHDPDIQHIPFFAVSTRFFDNIYSTYHKKLMVFNRFARFFVSLQHYLFYVVLTFGRFNLYVQSFAFLAANRSYPFHTLEVIGYLFFSCWFGYLLSLLPSKSAIALYVFVCHATTMLLHVQITISHFAMDTLTKDDKPELENESFAERALRTTMDVDCPSWMDGLHGGLQYQAIHHIFPRLPRHHLRKLTPVITQFSEMFNLRYAHYGFLEGNLVVLRAMRDVACQVHPFFNKSV